LGSELPLTEEEVAHTRDELTFNKVKPNPFSWSESFLPWRTHLF